MKLICQWCRKEFEGKVYRKFCSEKCRKEARQYYQHLYYVKTRKVKKTWKGLQEYDREKFQRYKKQTDRTKQEGKMFWVVRNEFGKHITFEEYLKELKKTTKYLSGYRTRLNRVGLRIFMFLYSLRRAWQTIVPKEDQDIDRVMRFLDAQALSKTLQDVLIRFLNLEISEIAI